MKKTVRFVAIATMLRASKTKNGALIILAALIHLGAVASKECETGATLLSINDSLTQWRTSITHAIAGRAVPTSKHREAKIKERQEFMEAYIFSDRDTPEMEFLPAEGTTVNVIRTYHNDTIPYIEVSGLGPEGILRGTFLLPVSGHVGIENAKKWAKTDTFSLYLENASDRKRSQIVTDAKSLGLVTAQEIEVSLKPDQLLKLTYYRSGSGGPSGYPSGRILEVKWDGT